MREGSPPGQATASDTRLEPVTRPSTAESGPGPHIARHYGAGAWYLGVGYGGTVLGMVLLGWESLAMLFGGPSLHVPPLSPARLLVEWVVLAAMFRAIVGLHNFERASWCGTMLMFVGVMVPVPAIYAKAGVRHPAAIVIAIIMIWPFLYVYFCWFRYFWRRRADYGVDL